RRTFRLPDSNRALALTALTSRRLPSTLERGSTLTTEFKLRGVLSSTARTPRNERPAALTAELRPLGILKSAAWTAHVASLLHRARQGKEKVEPALFDNRRLRAR